MHSTGGSSAGSHGPPPGASQRIREDFSRILEGIGPSDGEANQPVAEAPAAEMLAGRLPPGVPREAAAPQWYGAAPQEVAAPAGTPVSSFRLQGWQCGGCGPMVAALGMGKGATTPPLLPEELEKRRAMDLEKMFPFLFSFCGFMIFLGPIWLMVHLSHDPNIVYWVGHWCEIALFLPAPFFLAFFIQARLQRPHKATILLSLIVPAAVLLALSDVLVNIASDRGDQLQSRDCDTFAAKRELERSWQAAHRLYMGCLKQTVASHNMTMEQATTLFRVQDCQEFPTAYARHEKDWEYLWFLEEEHQCAGWCTPQQPVWTLKEVSDSCSAVVSQLFFGKVRRMAKQVIIFSIFILVGTSLANLAVGPGIRAMGIEW